ncbi:flagellar hook-associated protein FlgK [Eubacteriaceae bacterium ES2]|nr:flagellar hook-associated protein FlgK [Eubacteriaceae bacterium ES2]
MSTTFLSYYVANRAMETSQVSINTTGNNISNINTEGYTRQRADIVSLFSTSNSRYANTTVRAGLGAKATGISQIRDPYLDARYRAATGTSSRYDSIAESLSSLEDVFDEATTEALQGQLSDFLTDLESLSQSPTSADIEQVVRSSAEKVVTMINMYANDIEGVQTQQIEEMDNTINDDINTIVKKIAQLNQQIREEQVYGNTPNELYDSRNLLVDELSTFANIKVSTSAQVVTDNLSIENYVVSIVDDSTSPNTEIQLVNNEYYNQLKGEEIDVDGDGELDGIYQVTVDGNSQSILDSSITNTAMNGFAGTVINDNITEGSLSGLLDFVNGAGSFADAASGETEFSGIRYYMQAMDVFAQTFADAFNTINDVTSSDPSVVPLFTTDDGTTSAGITAANIQISQNWQDDPTFIVTTADTTTEGQADNVLRMIAAMSDDQTFLDDGGSTFYTGSFHEYMNGLLGELSTEVELNENFSDASNTVLDTLFTERESISGVSLNEEGTYLMAYQKCYNAAVRFFTVIDENVDRIINNMGTAGL